MARHNQDAVTSVSICEKINQPGSIPTAGDILTLPGRSHQYSGHLPVLDGHPGSVLRKLDWEGFIKELTILPYFSVDEIFSYAGR
jgi:hypothetical protein